MKQFVIETLVFGKWFYFSDHNDKDFAITNAENTSLDRNITIRVKDNGTVIKIFESKKLIKKRRN